MTTRRRTTGPVPMSPIHRRSWRSLWRRCTCGLKEPCIDRLTTAALYLPTDQKPPPPPEPPTTRPPEIPPVHIGLRPPVPTDRQPERGMCGTARRHSEATRAPQPPSAEHADVIFLDRTARPPRLTRVRPSASARVPVRQPGRAGSLTPAQARRADHAERRQDVPELREGNPGHAHGSGLPQFSPPHPSRGAAPMPARNRPGPGRARTDEGHRVGDATS